MEKEVTIKLKDNGLFETLDENQKKEYIRNGILKVEEKLSNMPGAIIWHDNDDSLLPLKHIFVDGAYVREIFMPAGTLLTSKIHKKRHPYFVLKGKCSVLTDEGVQKIEAPFYGITEPGTKRVLYINEDTTWVTVHVTEETDLDKIEKEIIAPNYESVLPTPEDIKRLKEENK